MNGCGSEKGLIKPPYHIYFEASCNVHDLNYDNGGVEKDRKKADLGLLKYMCKDVRRLNKWKRPYFYIWCIIYYFSVRMFGRKHFNYKKLI